MNLRKPFFYVVLLSISVSLVAIISCNKERETTRCTRTLKFDTPLSLSIDDEMFNLSTDLFNKNNERKKNYQISTSIVSPDDYKNIVSHVDSHLNLKSSDYPVEVVIYTKSFLDNKSVSDADIIGYSLYFYIKEENADAGIIRHKLFIKEANSFVEKRSYDMQTRGVITNMLTYIIFNEFSLEASAPKSYILIRSKETPNIKMKNDRDDFF
jgi:hypothetical protein